MANQDSNKEANGSKKIRMNITMSVEVNKDESGKVYQDLVKNITKEAMTCIDAALTGTTSNKQTINQETREITMDNSNLNETLNTNTIIETEAMKQIRLRLELKKSKQKAKNATNVTDTSATCEPETKKAKVSKRKTITNDKNETNETEAMKEIRQNLEEKKKLEQTTSTSAILSSPTNIRTYRSVLLQKKKAKGSKRTKRTNNEEDEDETNETEAMKEIRQSLEAKKKFEQTQNDKAIASASAVSSSPTTSGISKTISPQTEKATGSTRVHKRTTNDEEKVKTIETEAMKLIRQRLELKKKPKQNQNVVANATNSTSESVFQESRIAGRRGIKRNIANVDNTPHTETDKMKRTKLTKTPDQIENNNSNTITVNEIIKTYTTTGNTPRNTNITTSNISDSVSSVTRPNLPTNEFYEMTEDESEIEMADASEKTNTERGDNIIGSSSSTSSYYSARSGPEDSIASRGRRTRSKTAWERKLWTK